MEMVRLTDTTGFDAFLANAASNSELKTVNK